MAEPSSRRIPWRRIVIESGAVVLSILLAFAIDAMWDRHEERTQERVLLQGILADYRASRANLEERVELARRMARNTGLMQDLLSEWNGPGPVSVPDSLILGAMGGPTYEPAINTLDAALGSGHIELLQNEDIRAELANWRRTLIDTREDEVEVRRLTNEQLLPILGRSVDLGPYFTQLLNWSFEVPVSGLSGHALVRPSVELASLLGMRRFYVEFSADDLASLLASLDRSVELLEREIGEKPRAPSSATAAP